MTAQQGLQSSRGNCRRNSSSNNTTRGISTLLHQHRNDKNSIKQQRQQQRKHSAKLFVATAATTSVQGDFQRSFGIGSEIVTAVILHNSHSNCSNRSYSNHYFIATTSTRTTNNSSNNNKVIFSVLLALHLGLYLPLPWSDPDSITAFIIEHCFRSRCLMLFIGLVLLYC